MTATTSSATNADGLMNADQYFDYDLPDNGTITTANSTIVGGPTNNFLVRLRFRLPQDHTTEHTLHATTQLLKQWLECGLPVQLEDSTGITITTDNLPTSNNKLTQKFSYT